LTEHHAHSCLVQQRGDARSNKYLEWPTHGQPWHTRRQAIPVRVVDVISTPSLSLNGRSPGRHLHGITIEAPGQVEKQALVSAYRWRVRQTRGRPDTRQVWPPVRVPGDWSRQIRLPIWEPRDPRRGIVQPLCLRPVSQRKARERDEHRAGLVHSVLSPVQ
jgi:hypothetical protein